MNRKEGGPSRILAYALAAAMGFVVPWSVCGVSSVLAQLPPAPAGVEVTTIHGIEFSTIGNPGNAAFNSSEFEGRPNYRFNDIMQNRGTVNAAYRISRSEITASQWIDFATAIDPYWEGGRNDVRYTGQWTYHDGERYVTDPGRENDPVWGVTWLAAAAFCNWMTNDRRPGPDAFRTGAYDLRGINLANPAAGTPAISQNVNAAFRLPSFDEWNKATFFNPNRDGPGQPGWQRFSLPDDRPPVPGFVEEGGETYVSAVGFPVNRPRPVAAYTAIQTPWGLFDTSGGVFEFTNEFLGIADLFGVPYYRVLGTDYGSNADLLAIEEQPGFSSSTLDIANRLRGDSGVRLVWTIPSPSSAVACSLGFVAAFYRRRTDEV
jgi:sulfatase modifying factor 1